MPTVSRSDFLEKYEFPIEPWCDFQIEGQAPTWASGHPKEWFRDSQSIELPRSAKAEGQTSQIYKSIHSAISPDDRLLAVTSEDGTRILIYDIDSKELHQKLDGTGKIVFAPLPKKETEPNAPASNAIATPAYMLVSGIPGIDAPKHAAPNLIIWELDRHGRLLDEEEEVDASAFATKAVESITAQLEENHEWSKEFIASSDLHADFESALKRVAANHRRRHYATLSNAALPGFGALPFSSDGKFMLYHQGNHTDRKNASVVVWDVKAGKEVLRLTGHTDSIMWSSFSPDDKLIATVSWDGTMRMHSATTGELSWVTPDSGGQSWTGAFTPDSKHIAWSSERGQIVQVHDVADGKLISTLPVTFKEWCRCMTWHPDGQQLALCTGLTVYVWRPFDGLDGKFVDGEITQCFRLPKSEWRGFASIQTVKWIEHGRKLALLSTEGSSLVWDSQTNTKELFKRPQGELAAWTDDGFYYIADEGRNIGDVYLSIDGDGMVRYWRISVPGEPSWWDKKEEPAPKKEYPETGKYVNIVKQVKPKEVQEITEAKEGKEVPDIPEAKEGKEVLEITEAKKGNKVKEVSKENTRDAWVEHGAELWTAG